MSDEVVIDRRFRGPPDSANGGYTCGTLAAFVRPGPAVQVTLRAPPPLDKALRVDSVEGLDGGATMLDGEALIAEAEPAPSPDPPVPDPVSLEDAEAARAASPLHRHHPFSTCLVCGPDRGPGDGMRVICGPVEGREGELVAAPWEPDHSLAGEDGAIRDEIVWSALDCPSGLAGMLVPGFGMSVLGRLSARILRPVAAGTAYVAVGWPIERDGRKLHSAAAILDADGETVAVSSATWIELRDRRPGYGG